VDLITAIHSRQSIGHVKPDPVPRAEIEKLLAAAVQAPNHYKVRPWRFVVLTGKGLERLGDVMAASQSERFPELQAEALDITRALPRRAPLVIAVGVDKPAEPKVLQIENVCAAAAACNNILLAAHAGGLAAKWRTGEWASDAQVRAFLGFEPDQPLIAFLYIGYPEFVAESLQRPTFEDRVIWMD
jgi:nitroreductase